ncbi:MAG: hypothetical protein Q4B58_02995, partial [Bacteroidales bacterium]|nr:hypothetical protein [Bacteroidales bacterium]
QIPNLVIGSINKALFPEVMTNASSQRIGLILSYERKIGIGCMLLLALLGYPAVWLLGGKAMSDAYGVLLILTVTIYAGLIAGAYMQFCFIPQGRYSLIVRNRLWALASTLVLMVAGLWLLPSSMIAATALSVSGLIEVAYCRAKAQVTGD